MRAKDNGYRQLLDSKSFVVGELRRRCDVRRGGAIGKVNVGLDLVHSERQRLA